MLIEIINQLYSNWATMSYQDPTLIVKTLAMLPSEKQGLPQSEVDKETQYIIDNIVNKTNSEILHDKEIMKKISELGGDLIITVFACNFHIDGKVNEDITEANFLNRRMFERFSVTKRQDDPYTRELIVGSTTLEQETYGVALDKFKKRLGLKGDGDLTVLTLVPMSPFPTAHNLVKSFADTFKQAALDEIKVMSNRLHGRVQNRILIKHLGVFHAHRSSAISALFRYARHRPPILVLHLGLQHRKLPSACRVEGRASSGSKDGIRKGSRV